MNRFSKAVQHLICRKFAIQMQAYERVSCSSLQTAMLKSVDCLLFQVAKITDLRPYLVLQRVADIMVS